MNSVSAYVGLDVHKDTIRIWVADGDGDRRLGTIPNDLPMLLRRIQHLGEPASVRCCYEAGPTGFGLSRRLAEHGYHCDVIAPSLVPKKPGVRVKTDPRDASMLARYLRSGELTPVMVPDEKTEAMRDLERARDDAKQDEVRARHRLGKFLLRHDRRWEGKSNWTKAHYDWIRIQKFGEPAQDQVLREYLLAVERATEAVERLSTTIGDAIQGWSLQPLVRDLQTLRGVQLLTAVIIAAEVGDMRRFPTARKFMGYLGLVPSENTTGETHRRGPITRTGNRHLRRILVEAAWSYRFQPRKSAEIRRRSRDVDPRIEAIAWKAQERLHRKYMRMALRGCKHQKVVTAVARELAGFVWAVGTESLKLAAA